MHGTHGEDPTEATASTHYPFPAAVPRAADPAALRRPERAGLPPVPCPVRRPLLDERPARTASASAADCDGFPCLVHAKSDAEVIAVRPALEHPNVTLLTNAARRRASRPTAAAGGRPRRGRAGRGEETLSRRHRGRLGRARPTRPSCCSRRPTTGTRTASPTAPTRSAATTCSTTAGGPGASPRSRTRPVSRRRSGSTTSTSGCPASTTRWATSRWSASPTPRCTRARSRSRPSWPRRSRSTEVAKHAVDFWLSTEDLPRPRTG